MKWRRFVFQNTSETEVFTGFSDILRKMLTNYANRAPLRRPVTTLEVGNVAAFLCSDLASGVTGEITYVDGGFNTAAMSVEEYTD